MEPDYELLIRVHDAWQGWRSAEVRFGDLRDIHWSQPKGAPHSLIHAYVPCTAIVSGVTGWPAITRIRSPGLRPAPAAG